MLVKRKETRAMREGITFAGYCEGKAGAFEAAAFRVDGDKKWPQPV